MIFRQIFRDKEYLGRLTALAVPLIIQQVITYSVNLLDTLMIGSFGDIPLAAVNLVNQFYLIFSIMIFGMISGGSVLSAQFWGKRDAESIRKVMGIQFVFGFGTGLFFLAVTQAFPDRILRFYSKDEEVIRAGVTYLRIISAAFLLFPAGQVFSGALRCTGNTGVPMVISGITLSANALLNYLLIFGKLGFPALGLKGAAAATVIARAAETFLYIFVTYRRRYPIAATARQLFSFDRQLIGLLLQKGLPVIANELSWGLGVNMYTAIYSSISTASIAAYSAVSPIDNIAQSLFFGIGDASSVMTGNLLGADDFKKAKRWSKFTLTLSLCLSLLIGMLLFCLRIPIIGLYNLSPEASALAIGQMAAAALSLWLRTSNYTLIIGILRPGGQALYCLLIEGLLMWLGGIPLAWLLANRFRLPVYIVYFGNVFEEIAKLLILFRFYRGGKWLVNLVSREGKQSVPEN